MFHCKSCEMSFPTRVSLTRHEKGHANPLYAFKCTSCDIPFTRRDNLTRHNKKYHPNLTLVSSQPIKRKLDVEYPIVKKSRDFESKKALNDSCRKYSWELDNEIDASIILEKYKNRILELITTPNKWYLLVEVEFLRENETVFAGFRNKAITSCNSVDLNQEYKLAAQEIISNIESYETKGSGWIISKIMKIELHLVKYKPFANYFEHVNKINRDGLIIPTN